MRLPSSPTRSPRAAAPPDPSTGWPSRAAGGLTWFAGLLCAFLVIRAATTLAAGASFATPGDGWRSVWQLAVAALLVVGLARPAWLRGVVGAVAAVYLGCALAELVTPDALLGVIPVDMRDRVVHPLIGLLGAAAVLVAGRGGRTASVVG